MRPGWGPLRTPADSHMAVRTHPPAGLAHASGTRVLARHPCLPALLECGFREMAPREEKGSHCRGATHTCSPECVPHLGVSPQSRPDVRVLGYRVISVRKVRVDVCAPAVWWCVGAWDPSRRVKNAFLQKKKAAHP